MWERDGKLYTHADVVSLMEPGLVDDAVFAAEMARGKHD